MEAYSSPTVGLKYSELAPVLRLSGQRTDLGLELCSILLYRCSPGCFDDSHRSEQNPRAAGQVDITMDEAFSILHPSVSRMAQRLTNVSGWPGLIPVGFELISLQRPRVLVELGTHSGDSYCAFCQAVEMVGADTRCYAVDTWTGDEHAGHYGPEVLADLRAHHDPRYSGCSLLLQSSFDDAVSYFEDGSIDVLHIDGLHTYDPVKHDFLAWKPALSHRAIVLLHDICVRENDFGVWWLWQELATEYSALQLDFRHGLGLLAAGEVDGEMKRLFALDRDGFRLIHDLLEALGRRVIDEAAVVASAAIGNAELLSESEQYHYRHRRSDSVELN